MLIFIQVVPSNTIIDATIHIVVEILCGSHIPQSKTLTHKYLHKRTAKFFEQM